MVSRLGYEHMGLRYPYEDDRQEISESEERTGEGEEKDEQIRFM